MTFINGNRLGILMFVVAALVAGAGSLLLKLPDPVTMIAVGVALIGMDSIVRLRSRATSGWLMHKELGGYLYFIPVWVAGIVVIVINLIASANPNAFK
ncbi:MAG: hypothetical protein LCI00_14205 [Chloroflexi bacterium]|nr:hypothetical protein [Chloroflexota bacterium]MCC6896835.1 hypothetical protein [Anaerolineae bacterium]